MKILLTTILFLNSFTNCFSQCNYVWLNNSLNSIDTIRSKTNWIYNDKSGKENFDFSRLIQNIRKYKLDGELRKRFLHELDSLKFLKCNSAISKEIEYLENELGSHFQLIKHDSVEFALYKIDTLTINNETVILYKFSSNFESEWNEDYRNWQFYYTKEFGVIQAAYVCIFDFDDTKCGSVITLIDNCYVKTNPLLFSKLMKNFKVNEIKVE